MQVNHNNTIIKFWDTGVELTADRKNLVAYFEDHEEILLEHWGYESVSFHIYNLRLGAYTDYSGYCPHFNNSRDAVISIEDIRYYNNTAFISVYTIDNGVYSKVLAEGIETSTIGEMQWVNDDEFRLELAPPEIGDSVFLIKRTDAGFELLQEP